MALGYLNNCLNADPGELKAAATSLDPDIAQIAKEETARLTARADSTPL
jgi:hypothetical protein